MRYSSYFPQYLTVPGLCAQGVHYPGVSFHYQRNSVFKPAQDHTIRISDVTHPIDAPHNLPLI